MLEVHPKKLCDIKDGKSWKVGNQGIPEGRRSRNWLKS